MPQFTVEATKGGKPVTLRVTAESRQAAAEKAMLTGHSVQEIEPFDPDIQVVHNATTERHSAESAELLHATLVRSYLQDIDKTYLSFRELVNISVDFTDSKSQSNISSLKTNMQAWGFISTCSLALTAVLVLLRGHNPQSIAGELVWALAIIGLITGIFAYLYYNGLQGAKSRREVFMRDAQAGRVALESWKIEQYNAAKSNPAGFVQASIPKEVLKLRPKA